MLLNINNSAVVKFTNTLEKMHKSALPVAIRGTINNAAFDVKQRTMPRTADQAFNVRQKNFFKANSRVEMAKGFNLASMHATVGFTGSRLRGGNNFAVKDLQQQEFGGTITNRSFIPTDEARGKNKAKPVRPSNRLSAINNLVDSNKVSGSNRKQRYLKAALKAGKGGHVLGNFNKKRVYKITSIRRVKNRTIVNSRALYTFEQNRSVNVKPTAFMRIASIKSGNKMNNFYIQQANKQIHRLNKK